MRVNMSPLRRSAAALLLAAAMASSAAARTNESAASTTASSATSAAVARIRIDNFGQVSPIYFRGAQPVGQDYVDLAALGVKTVINLTSDDAEASEPAMAERAGMTYVQIPMTTHEPPTPAQLAEFLKIVNEPANQPVFVHCVGGRHRTGVMTAAYRITQDGWTAAEAFEEMKQFKFGADFLHPEFKSFVYGYPAELTRSASAKTAVATVKAGS